MTQQVRQKEENMMILEWFQENIFSNTLMMVFLIAAIGYLVGRRIKIKGLGAGTAEFFWLP